MAVLLLPLLAAVLRVASLPGWVLGPLCLPFAALRIAAWERGLSWRGDWLGGFVFWLLTFSFLTHVHWLFPLGPAATLAFWWVAEGLAYRGLRRKLPPSLAGPLALCAAEWLRALLPMGGVPWALLSLGLADQPAALFLARSVGESGLVVLVALWGGCLYALARRRHVVELAPAPALTALAAVASLLAPAPERSGSLVPPVQCLAVQPDISLEEKHDETEQDVLRRQAEVTTAALAAAPGADLVLWAETMFPLPVTAPGTQGVLTRPSRWSDELLRYPAAEAAERAMEFARGIGRRLAPSACFVTGAHWYAPVAEEDAARTRSARRSAAVVFAADGRILAHAAKTELVPFGERLPLDGRFPGGRALGRAIYRAFGLRPDFQAPPRPSLLRFPWAHGELQLGVAICWENVFEAVFRRQAAGGAEAFLVLSNEAWYGTSEEMDQMVAATRFRAAETGRAVLRATNNGWTVLVDAGGRLQAQLERGRSGWLAAGLPRVSAATVTPYLLGGWLLLPAVAVLGWGLAAWGWWAPRRRLDPT
ncbi:MAG: apolipoprotein N-acyltransferase [Planctomycetota bacterium]|nr:MAG: apolipoprotein N-acyltransferase [Planctomycetota bacterium]